MHLIDGMSERQERSDDERGERGLEPLRAEREAAPDPDVPTQPVSELVCTGKCEGPLQP